MRVASPQIAELADLLEQGSIGIGQIRICKDRILHHYEDTQGDPGLKAFSHPEAAREIAQYDDEGNYRPLKTAPNLKKGWLLKLSSIEEVKLALDFFYPAAWGTWLAFRRDKLVLVDLRETLSRQTGMYRVTQKISDEEAREVIVQRCNGEHGCLRRILWKIAPAASLAPFPAQKFSAHADAGEIPILCAEACNILIAALRKKVKGEKAE